MTNQASRIGLNLLVATKGRDPEPLLPGAPDGYGETTTVRVAEVQRRFDEAFSDANSRRREAG